MFAACGETRPGRVDPDDPPGFSGQPSYDPAKSAAQFEDRIAGPDLSKRMIDFRLEVLTNPRRSDLVTSTEPVGGKLFRVIIGHSFPSVGHASAAVIRCQAPEICRANCLSFPLFSVLCFPKRDDNLQACSRLRGTPVS